MPETSPQRGDLTDADYWGSRQRGAPLGNTELLDATYGQFLPPLLPHLQRYHGQRLLELGASPGHVSALICKQVPLEPHGVDFSPEAEAYLATLRAAGFSQATLHRCDLRDFRPERLYDVVASFGLVEHFDDPQPMLDEHDRLLRPGGLCIVAMPNFHGLQYAYHWLFDRPDLRRHNLGTMRPDVLRVFADRHRMKIHVLAYTGRLCFWNVDPSGGFARQWTRRLISRLWREAGPLLGRFLPAAHPWFAPWLVLVAEKPA